VFAISSVKKDSFYDRLQWWTTAVHMFCENPVNGIGWGNFCNYNKVYKTTPGVNALHVHNLPLEIMADTGLLGIIGFLSLFLGYFFRKEFHNNELRSVSILVIAGMICENMLNFSFFIPAVMILIAVTMGISNDSQSVKRTSPFIPHIVFFPLAGILLSIVYVCPFIAKINLDKGLYWEQKKQPVLAMGCYKRAISFDSLFWDPYNQLAKLYLGKYRFDGDKAFLQKAIQLQVAAVERSRQNAGNWVNLGRLYQVSGDIPSAERSIACAIRNDSFSPLYHNAMKSLFEKMSDSKR
jgi:tetratricopeptide (TPR) repeat protein